MKLKKDRGRFTVRFDMENPDHVRAVEYLERQRDRGKAQYCVLTYGKLTLAYQTGTYANFGVTMTSQNTSPYNTYGRICRWTSNPTNWTHVS
jgi:hypothetical protein